MLNIYVPEAYNTPFFVDKKSCIVINSFVLNEVKQRRNINKDCDLFELNICKNSDLTFTKSVLSNQSVMLLCPDL